MRASACGARRRLIAHSTTTLARRHSFLDILLRRECSARRPFGGEAAIPQYPPPEKGPSATSLPARGARERGTACSPRRSGLPPYLVLARRRGSPILSACSLRSTSRRSVGALAPHGEVLAREGALAAHAMVPAAKCSALRQGKCACAFVEAELCRRSASSYVGDDPPFRLLLRRLAPPGSHRRASRPLQNPGCIPRSRSLSACPPVSPRFP